MEAKETNYKSILKSNIVLFLSYSILIGFVFLLVVIFIQSALNNVSNTLLSILLSLIGGIIIFHTLHFICKSSTLESLKKAKLDDENSKTFIKKMNLFFIVCMIISILICIGYLFTDNLIYSNAIKQAHIQFDFISIELSDRIINHINKQYQSSFLSKICSTIITELSLVVSFISLIHYQPKLLSKYNKV